MICPECGSEYRDGFVQCADCDVPLVEGVAPAEEEAQDDVHLVKVFETNDPAAISFVRSLFDAAPFPYVTRNQLSQSLVPGAAHPFGSLEFWVNEADEAEARELLSGSIPEAEEQGSASAAAGPRIEIARYEDESSAVEQVAAPAWGRVEEELRTMDRLRKPILYLLPADGDVESNCMVVTGGDGVYHLEIADPNRGWVEAVNPGGGDDEVEVWTSDQGMTTQRRLTWSADDAVRIARWYWENRTAHPEVTWE